jgi:hypothetical protein
MDNVDSSITFDKPIGIGTIRMGDLIGQVIAKLGPPAKVEMLLLIILLT